MENNLQRIKEAFYILVNKPDLTIEEVREIAEGGYLSAHLLNLDLENIRENISRITTI